MDFWTFVIILVIIGMFKDILKKSIKNSGTNKKEKPLVQEIDSLEQHLHEIEKRLQAIETIVVDEEYYLNMKFKKALGKENRSSSNL